MDQPQSTPPAGDSPFAPHPIPRLSIFHLMLWTACSAGYLGLGRFMSSLQDDLPEGYAALQKTSSGVGGVIFGAMFTGAIVLVYVRARGGRPMLRQPGHWLVFVPSVAAVGLMPISLLMALLNLVVLDDSSRHVFTSVTWLVYAAADTVFAIGFILAFRRTGGLRWRSLFAAVSVEAALQCMGDVFYSISKFGYDFYYASSAMTPITNWTPRLLAVWLVVVVILDLRSRISRDWIHWTGVVTYLAYFGVGLYLMISARFIQP